MKTWVPLIVGTPPLTQLLLRGAGPVLPPLFLPSFHLPPLPTQLCKGSSHPFRCPRPPASAR